MLRKLVVIPVALALAAGPAVAQSNAAPLSLATAVRAGAETGDTSEIRGGFILPTLAIAAIIAALLLLKPFGGDDPASP